MPRRQQRHAEHLNDIRLHLLLSHMTFLHPFSLALFLSPQMMLCLGEHLRNNANNNKMQINMRTNYTRLFSSNSNTVKSSLRTVTQCVIASVNWQIVWRVCTNNQIVIRNVFSSLMIPSTLHRTILVEINSLNQTAVDDGVFGWFNVSTTTTTFCVHGIIIIYALNWLQQKHTQCGN